MRLRCFFFITALFLCVNVHAQLDSLRHRDYTKADSVALHTQKKKGETYPDLAHRLADSFPTEEEKYRVIFRWITENVRYSYAGMKQDASKAYEKGYAVCAGYSDLLHEMCEYVGLDCVTITGVAKNEGDDLSRKFNELESHAWNAIRINGRYYLCDATWAAGTYDKKIQKFTKRYNDHFFLADPVWFGYSHFPKDPKWQLREKPMTQHSFLKNPIVLDSAEDVHFSPPAMNGLQKHRLSGRYHFHGTNDSLTSRINLAFTEKVPAYSWRQNKAMHLAVGKHGAHDVIVMHGNTPVLLYRTKTGKAAERRFNRQQKRQAKRVKKLSGG